MQKNDGVQKRGKKVGDAYDKAYLAWEEVYSDDQYWLYKNPVIRFIFDQGHRWIASCHTPKSKSVMEIGCGIGYHLKFEDWQSAKRYVCLDLRQNMLDAIKEKGVDKQRKDVETDFLGDNEFDIVIASHVLEHLRKLDAAIKGIKRSLKVGGELIVVLPADPGWLWQAVTRFSPSRWRLNRRGISYEEVMRYEHVNPVNDIIHNLENAFAVKQYWFFPFKIKSTDLNLFVGLRCVKTS